MNPTATLYTRSRAARIAAARIIRTRIGAALDTFLNRALRARGLVTISQVLADLGADADLVRRYASHAGKKVKAAYLAAHGREPVQVWKVVTGRPRQVLAYNPTEPVIRDGLAAYQRTAHLVAT
ncbi:hypothetical protein ACFWU5_16560 [Nocardia sp. NPDC058640]|uniref:hypothetical protein n=1 Tax=Nocardia sp. NPDC058640 TaxID=3346571 RepID=UPI00365386A9